MMSFVLKYAIYIFAYTISFYRYAPFLPALYRFAVRSYNGPFFAVAFTLQKNPFISSTQKILPSKREDSLYTLTSSYARFIVFRYF